MHNFKCGNMKPSKSKNIKAFLLLGPAGSGKGTQAKLLCKKFDLEYIGSGDVLRAIEENWLPVLLSLKS